MLSLLPIPKDIIYFPLWNASELEVSDGTLRRKWLDTGYWILVTGCKVVERRTYTMAILSVMEILPGPRQVSESFKLFSATAMDLIKFSSLLRRLRG